MKRFCFGIAAMILTCSLVTATSSLGSIFPAKKGKIQGLSVSPTPPTTSSPVSLHVSATTPLQVDRVTVDPFAHRFVVSVYWSDAPTGDTSPGQCTQPLGTLSSGYYAVLVISYYKGMMVDFRSMMFLVQ